MNYQVKIFRKFLQVVHSIMEDIQRVLKDVLNKGIKWALHSVSVLFPSMEVLQQLPPLLHGVQNRGTRPS